jgi:putative ABC transport system permease protein
MGGMMSDMLKTTAHYETGHVRIMTQAYAQEASQLPNDLAIVGLAELSSQLNKNYPQLNWTPRIKFGGIFDVPDENGETKDQAPVSGMGVDLFSPNSREAKLLNIEKSLVAGRLPSIAGEILIGDEFFHKMNMAMGESATLISSTMYGSMAMGNLTVVGTVRFGISALDRGAIIADITDIQRILDMEDATSEILGFFPDDVYNDAQATIIMNDFNAKFSKNNDQFSPKMGSLPEESGMEDFLALANSMSSIIIGIFVLAMAIVLWNAGLMGSLRRYGEFGVRLAIGERKSHVYNTLIVESLVIGIIGSLFGTLLGVIVSYLIQIYGIDLSFLMKNSSMMMSGVYRAQVTLGSFFIGFIPGILATFIGGAFAGISIFKRNTSQLFKELEA